ncbi:hypothetical protein ACSVBT_05440 [Afipia sp. TerB]
MSPAGPEANQIDARASSGAPLKIFLAALAIRWIYALTIYRAMGDGGLQGIDSIAYIGIAKSFVQALHAGTLSGGEWLGTYSHSMPLFHWLSAMPFIVLGEERGILGYVLLQGALDAGTCVAVFFIAQYLSPKLALPASVFAVFNPTQIVLSGLFFTDTPFTFFFAVSLLLTLRWAQKPTWSGAALIGAALGCASMTRILIVPWAVLTMSLMAVYSLFTSSVSKKTTVLASAAVFGLCIGAILTKNVALYRTIGLTSQSGAHLAFWIVPLAKEMKDRTPYAATASAMERRTRERFGPQSANPFEQSARYKIVAGEALREIPLTAFVKSWLSGMAINLLSPAALQAPPVLQLPHGGFYETSGSSFPDKVYNYAFHSRNSLYAGILILGAFGLGLARLVQLIGAISLARQRNWFFLALGGSWIVYILVVSGPIAAPKYRLPIEPLLNIATGAGYLALRRKFKPLSIKESSASVAR